MAHLGNHKKRLVSRIRRIQGQLDAVIRAIDNNEDCNKVLQTTAACRGAFTGLFTELLNDHIDTHVSGAKNLAEAKSEAKKLNGLLRSYLR